MALPTFFITVEDTIDANGLPVVKLLTSNKGAFGGNSIVNHLLPDNLGGTSSAARHVGADASNIYSAKTDVFAKMALLYNSHGQFVTPIFGQAVTAPSQPFNFVGLALTSTEAVSDNWNEPSVQVGGFVPPNRDSFNLVYISDSQKVLLFGGENNGARLADSWEWDGKVWTQKIVASPSARANYAIANGTFAFNNTNTTVMFGGFDGSLLNQTWNYTNTGWIQQSPGSSPQARVGHTLVYDSQRQVMVLFGGNTLSVYHNDTWEYNGITWTQIVTAHAPSARSGHTMTYDPFRNKTILFAGRNNSTFYGDTWEYNGTDWTQVFVNGTLPITRDEANLVFNTTQKKAILFGGIGPDFNELNDTWQYDGISWTQVNVFGPSSRYGFGMAYDANRDKTVLFGGANSTIIGALGETWEFGSPLRPVSIQTTGDGLVYYDATAGRPTPVIGDFLGPSAEPGTVTPLYDGYSPVFGIVVEPPQPLSTILDADINTIVTTITAASTVGFPTSGTIIIDLEQITYTGTTPTTFTGCTRGANSTIAANHTENTTIFSTIPLTQTINGSLVGIVKMRIRPFYGFIPPIPPSITNFSPSAAKVGETVTLTGSVFIGTTQVTINDTPSANATFNVISNNQITITVPAGAQQGTITVTNAQGNSTSSTSFTTLPSITSATASSYSVGSTVAIMGHAFTYISQVNFNGVSASYTFQNDGYVTAVIPVGGTTGDLDVIITYPDLVSYTATLTNFSVVAPPQITNVAPLAGPIGAFVSITGSGLSVGGAALDGYGKVDFVDVATMTQILPATRTIFNDTTISAIVPNPGVPQPSKAYYVRITTNGGVVLSSQQYTIIPVPKFLAAPGPTFISQTGGATGVAGQMVRIFGDYGFTGASLVTFTGNASPSINFINDGYITAIIPSVSSATDIVGPISVTSTGGTKSTSDTPVTAPINFTILQIPTITSFSPGSGKTGDTVVLHGTNLLSVSSVKFESMASSAVFSIINTGQINITVPSSGSGINPAPTTCHIIIDKGPFEVTSTGTFLYYVPPAGLTISNPAADSGGVNGGNGTAVTLTGTGLAQGGTPTITLGGQSCTVNSASDLNVIFTAPSGVANGTVTLTLTTQGGAASISFVYLAPCSITSYNTGEYYDPHSARVNYGGDIVDVYGSNFRASPNMQVYVTNPSQGYAAIFVSFTFVNSTHIQFNTSSLGAFAVTGQTCYISTSTNYPGGSYTAYVGGFTLFYAIG